MTPEEKVQALLRLKRHEQPPDGYFDRFLEEFHQRQRKEILQKGSLSLLWERIGTWMDSVRRPAVGWSVAGAYAALILLICLWPKRPRGNDAVTIVAPIAAGAQANISPPAPRETIMVNLPTSPANPEGEKKKALSPAEAQKLIGPAESEPTRGSDPSPTPAPKLREL